MIARWKQYRDLPYSVSDWGTVRNDRTGRILEPSYNQDEILYVALILDDTRSVRSLARMIAEVWVECPHESFDTVIHKDGNRFNVEVNNLAWRPRAYALRYNAAFRRVLPGDGLFKIKHPAFVETTTGLPFAFENTAEAAVAFGVLEYDITNNLSANHLLKVAGEPLQPIRPFTYIFSYL